MKTLIRFVLSRQLVGHEHEQPSTGVLVPKLNGPALALILDCCVLLFAIGVVANQLATAHAATYYVSQASNANDTNLCLLVAPCRTIARDVTAAQSPGDVVFVSTGTYVESVTHWPWSGAPSKPITIKAYPRDTVVWTSSNTDSGSRDGAITISSRNGDLPSYIRIEGFQFEGSKTRYTIRLQNEDSTQNSFPMGGFEIVNNTFVSNGNDGVRNGGSASATIFLQSIGRAAFPGPVSLISGNRFEDNFGAEIWMRNSHDVRVTNNNSASLLGSQSRSIHEASVKLHFPRIAIITGLPATELWWIR